jgi:hypothetical protein
MDENWAVKYRQFRWVLEIPDLPSWTLTKVEMPQRHLWLVSFYYINDMEPGTCPIQQMSYGTLKLLSGEGGILKTCKFQFHLMEYVPVSNLDYRSSDPAIGQVVLDVTNQEWT